MKSKSDEAETIRHQMARIRRAHHEEIGGVFLGAEKVAGWGRHIRLITWGALGAAAVLWMFANRSRKVPVKTLNQETSAADTEINGVPAPAEEPSVSRSGLLDGAANFFTTLAIRAAQNYRGLSARRLAHGTWSAQGKQCSRPSEQT